MKRTITSFLAAFAALSGAAYADTGLAGDISIETHHFVSSRSHTEVRAELDAFKKSGVNPWARNFDVFKGFKSTRTPAEVATEYIASREAVAAFGGEDSGSMYLAETAAAAQRAARMASTGAAWTQQ